MTLPTLHVLTLNIHKGFSSFNRRFVLRDLRDALHTTQADIIFLQEVTGSNRRKSSQHADWQEPQHLFLADALDVEAVYGKNAVHRYGHYGNAILSRFPILRWENIDISAHPSEKRGMLHSEIAVPGIDQPVHAFCVHLGLLKPFRRKQYLWIRHYISTHLPPEAPVIVAGDFNDWNCEADHHLAQPLNLVEVSKDLHGRHARTFPSFYPALQLDRIYLKGLIATELMVHRQDRWSDHAALSSRIRL
ncbi:MAG: EEP domain-containing protein [Gemmatimonadetes bacterium]|nr:MAG: EEP domain-containing protein [Gemmatimonadota bacterium]